MPLSRKIKDPIMTGPASFEELSRSRPDFKSGQGIKDWVGHCMASGCSGVRALRDALSDGLDPNGEARQPHPSGTKVSLPVVALAARQGNMPALRALLKAGAHPDGPMDCVFTPLTLACVNGQAEAVGLLLKSGADPNLSGSEGLPLEFAIRMREVEVAKEIALAGARAGAGTCMAGTLSAAEYARDQELPQLAEWLVAFEFARSEQGEISQASHMMVRKEKFHPARSKSL